MRLEVYEMMSSGQGYLVGNEIVSCQNISWEKGYMHGHFTQSWLVVGQLWEVLHWLPCQGGLYLVLRIERLARPVEAVPSHRHSPRATFAGTMFQTLWIAIMVRPKLIQTLPRHRRVRPYWRICFHKLRERFGLHDGCRLEHRWYPWWLPVPEYPQTTFQRLERGMPILQWHR